MPSGDCKMLIGVDIPSFFIIIIVIVIIFGIDVIIKMAMVGVIGNNIPIIVIGAEIGLLAAICHRMMMMTMAMAMVAGGDWQ